MLSRLSCPPKTLEYSPFVSTLLKLLYLINKLLYAVAYQGGVGVFKTPPKKILKALQNRAKLKPIVKTVKNY